MVKKYIEKITTGLSSTILEHDRLYETDQQNCVIYKALVNIVDIVNTKLFRIQILNETTTEELKYKRKQL